ncbi:MAG: hypothetical protein OEZ02_11035 [Anaerolineae bacterium]|nr:hypothetical protein [Anaerolineae bacterium]
MDFLLDPNIAYLVIIAALLLTVFALLTPGTGVFELSALFMILLSGWAMYTLPINIWALLVLALGVFPFLGAARRTRELFNLGIATAAFVIGSAYLFAGPVWWQPGVHPVLTLVTSVLAGGFFWLAIVNILDAESGMPTHDLSGLVGVTGEAKTDIHREGSVQVAGEHWTARSETRIKSGSKVKVIGREGLVLIVEKGHEKG